MHRGVCPVDVICVCNANGEIRPLRVQLVDEMHQLVRINIEQIVSTETVEHVGAEATLFRCRATVWGRACLFELKYSIRTHTWSMLRKIY